jgi:hypothetical protein
LPRAHTSNVEMPEQTVQLPTGHVRLSLFSWTVIYSLATYFTQAAFYGDSRAYAGSILDFTQGQASHFWQDNAFWEFGHLLWRPLGWLTFKILQPLTAHFISPEPRINIAIGLFALTWVAGLFSVLLLRMMLRRIGVRPWAANLATLAFLFSQGFLNFSQTGVPYIPGLCLILVSMYVLITGSDDSASGLKNNAEPEIWRVALIAGLAFAGAVCLWCLYALATPAIALTPLIFAEGAVRNRVRLGVQTCILAALITLGAYIAVVAHLHLYRMQDLLTWISTASHGVDHIRGFSRAMFGFARSFVNMGRDGLLYKRFLLHDPFNPVSFAQLLRLSLGKILLFYSAVICVLAGLFRHHDRKLLWGLAVAALPVLGFGVYWQGGDMERYLAIYPLAFVALAVSLGSSQSSRRLKSFLLLVLAFAVVTNCVALSNPRLERQKRVELDRVALLPSNFKPGSRVVLLHHELEVGSDPLHSLAEEYALPTYTLLIPGTAGATTWRQDFAAMALAAWKSGAEVWISNHLLDDRPAANLNWVEGEDRRISWSEIHAFFSALKGDASVGGSEGFELVSPAASNQLFLQSVLSGKANDAVAQALAMRDDMGFSK